MIRLDNIITEEFGMAVGSSLRKQWNERDYFISVPRSTRDHEKRCLSKLSSQSKLATLATLCIDNPLMRLISFTSYDDISLKVVAEDGETMELFRDRICIPILTSDIPNNELEEAFKTKHKEKLEQLKEDIETKNSLMKDFSEIGTDIFPYEEVTEKIIDTLTSNRYLIRAARLKQRERRKLLLDQLREVFEKLKESDEYKKKQASLSKLMSIAERIYSSISDIYFYDGLLKGINKIFSFNNSIKSFEGKYEMENLVSLLSYLEKEKIFLDGYCRGFCLNENCDYSFLTRGKISTEKCSKCGGNVFSLYCAKVSPDIEDSWKLGVLPEIIVAYVLKHSEGSKEWVENVIVHKEIQMKKNGDVTKNVPIDVIIHTRADEVIFIEVTSSSDLNHVVPNFQRKLKNLEEYGIIYDALIYITPVSQYEYSIPGPSQKAVMLTLKHIKKLDGAVTNVLKNQLNLKLC